MSRHCRIITKPRYLDDYVLLADQESEMLVLTMDGELENYLEAEHIREWIEDMVAKLELLQETRRVSL